ncbi:carboxymuconolactone decarboxylase family protein [bacterium]|nr:carboxymuconolactone decarboxylase family protein [bacterium]MCI0601681.1 carboxymuconolactone decarboxylase family protein [bacterium]
MPDPSLEQILALVRISSCVALRNEPGLRKEFQEALQGGLPITQIREAVLQTYLFAGYAATINAFILLNDLAPGNTEFLREESASYEHWQRRGEELCQKIYGSQYEKLVQNMKQLHPDLSDWMIQEGYGKVLSRPFLSPVVRELLIVAMTAVLQVERQFYSHVRGALNVGASPQQVSSVFEEVQPYIEEDTYRRFKVILTRVTNQ